MAELKKYTKEELAAILTAHRLWLSSGQLKGARADLSYSDLSYSNLSGSNLSYSNLCYSNLRYSDLSGSNLSGSNLGGSDLSGSNLSGSNLGGSDLSYSNLSGSNLSYSNLGGSDLSGSDLRYSDLGGSNLRYSDLSGSKLSYSNLGGSKLSDSKNLSEVKNGELVFAQTSIVPQQGSFEGWKKCADDVLVRVLIPAKAKRSNASGRKCRASEVKVLEVIGAKIGISKHDGKTEYAKGKKVKCDKWDDNRWEECAGGIHFFITREEAEAYS